MKKAEKVTCEQKTIKSEMGGPGLIKGTLHHGSVGWIDCSAQRWNLDVACGLVGERKKTSDLPYNNDCLIK